MAWRKRAFLLGSWRRWWSAVRQWKWRGTREGFVRRLPLWIDLRNIGVPRIEVFKEHIERSLKKPMNICHWTWRQGRECRRARAQRNLDETSTQQENAPLSSINYSVRVNYHLDVKVVKITGREQTSKKERGKGHTLDERKRSSLCGSLVDFPNRDTLVVAINLKSQNREDNLFEGLSESRISSAVRKKVDGRRSWSRSTRLLLCVQRNPAHFIAG